VSGMGLQREGNTGSLIIDFDVEFPAALSKEQIEALSAIL
jgi:DnaJ-class molecular chaperone